MAESSLPPEVSNIIISQLKHDFAALKAISLTCKQWLFVARPFLYSSVLVTIRHAQPATDSANILAVVHFPGYKPEYTTHLTLQSSPHIILSFSSSLSLGLPLNVFTNVHTLTLSRIHIAELPAIPPQDTFSRRITTLRLHRLYYTHPKDFTKLILAFSSVRCFSSHPIEGNRFRTDSYVLGAEAPPLELLPPIECFSARLDLSPGFPAALLGILSEKRCVRRLSVVTTLASRVECSYLSELLTHAGAMIPMWDLGLNWKSTIRYNASVMWDLRFWNLRGLQTWTVSLLDFGIPYKHALSYIFIQDMLGTLVSFHHPHPNFHTIRFSFVAQSTSLRDIKRTLAIRIEEGLTANLIDLDKTEIEGIMDCPSTQDSRADERRFGHFRNIYSGRSNVWSVCDFELAKSQIREVVVEVHGLERADSFTRRCQGGFGGNDASGRELDKLESEMEVDELTELVQSLFPLCVEQGLDVRGELGIARRVSGIWGDHDCSQLTEAHI
ncbi:hypothetical protein BDN72DRAFT_838842 [Pluteus cervinus]|uniref:Uncharacterized protein n=1 Tax=Pluteus cervinus TaxID=181527 RepID=A0ACD3AYP6_9AGAR|nr:hypothetical protein BDN72DRAFT_838842 [Pluteus cervinus]